MTTPDATSGPERAEEPWGPGKVRPSEPEPRPPIVAHLGIWWLIAAVAASGIAWAATDHMLRATLSLGGACLAAAALRLVLPPERAGGLIIRSRGLDVLLLVVLGAAVLFAGYALDLRARI